MKPVTPADLEAWASALALRYGKDYPEAYVQPGWRPHEWVVRAVMCAYVEGGADMLAKLQAERERRA